MALSTSLTKVTRVGLSSFQNYEINAVSAVGVATFSNFKTGHSNVHDIGFDVFDTTTGAGATIRSTGNLSLIHI